MTNEQRKERDAISNLLEALEDYQGVLPPAIIKALDAVLNAIRERESKRRNT